MKIWISSEALTGEDETLLWSGALYGLKRLQGFGHSISFDAESLSERQRRLLKNDDIVTSDFHKEDAALLINVVDDEKLKAVDSDGIEIEKAENWTTLSDRICFPTRRATFQRKTDETQIEIELNLDGSGESDISTGLGFFDHMLEQIAKHGLIDLKISCKGDLHVDEHHTIEDIAIALGETLKKAVGNKLGIERYSFSLPMDETLARIALDLSGRPYLNFEGNFDRDKVGDFPTEMVEHFFYSLAIHLQATLHITVKGENDHHKVEACFKGFARCLRAAVSRSERNKNILPTTKNLL